MYLHKTPRLIRAIAHDFIWRIPTDNREAFLTFDDGPTPVITEKILDILAQFDAKATFFCIGKNAQTHPQIVTRILNEGHAIGNHTQTHRRGWKTGYAQYLRDVVQAKQHLNTTLFRPPYGQITRSQTRALKNQFHLIMWDILSGDFDPEMSVEQCIQIVSNQCVPGSIVVFHDSMKASPILLQSLPIILQQLKEKGFAFSAISPAHVRST
ncbi:MAG: polysaccharide deacetylase family protein [Bacteroidetes bacterium]|nr:polysaccharide deacetylase family protein [Bacteroidota bacterium]